MIQEDVNDGQGLLELKRDFGASRMQSGELASTVSAWKDGAISRDTMLELFGRGEILPEGRRNADEMALFWGGEERERRGGESESGGGGGAVEGGVRGMRAADPGAMGGGVRTWSR